MLTNRITSHENASSALSGHVLPPAVSVAGQMQPMAQGPLALQIVAMQQAYERALQAAREDAYEFIARQRQSSLN